MGALTLPHVKLSVIRDCAAGELTTAQLAEKYGATPAGVDSFKQREKDRIARQRENMEDEMASLWIADKKNRIASYQEMAEQIQAMADASPDFLRLLQSALKNVAEETGQLPNRTSVQINGETVHYKIEGVDLGDLR